jgi:hypothetical protein
MPPSFWERDGGMKSRLRLFFTALIITLAFSSTVIPLVPVTGVSSLSTSSKLIVSNTASPASKIDLAGAFTFSVIQQPKGNAGFVSLEADKLTQFSLATRYGSQGFLAHNYLAGASFFNLTVGSQITVTYADGHSMAYEVQEIRHLQAISPNSPTTNFRDLDHKNTKLTAKALFMQTYGVKDRLVLQTCIAKDKEQSWGRLFIIATPVK